MTLLLKSLTALASLFLTFTLVVALLAYVVMGTPEGHAYLHAQTEAAVTRLLGPDLKAEFGTQSTGLGRDGTLAITWEDVRLTATGAAMPATEISGITVGFDPLALLTGRFALDRLEITGAAIDLTRSRVASGRSLEEEAPSPPVRDRSDGDGANAERAIEPLAILDSQFAMLLGLGVRHLSLSDIDLVLPVAKDGGPFVSRIEKADLDLSRPEALTVSARLGVDRLTIDLSGEADFDASAGRLRTLALSLGPLDLGAVVPPGSPDDRKDSRPFATDASASMTIDLSTDESTGVRTTSVGLGLGSGAVQTGKGHTRIETAKLDFQYREGGNEVRLLPSLLVFDSFSMLLDGRVGPIEDAAIGGGPGDVAFELNATDLRSTIGDPKPRSARARLEGRTERAASRVSLSRLELETDSGILAGAAMLAYGTPASPIRLDLASDALSAADVKAFWPYNIAPNARRWILGHVGSVGSVRDVSLDLDLTQARLGYISKPGNHPGPEELRLGFDFDGASLATTGDLPDLVKTAGRVETTGGDTIVRLASATLDGFETVTAQPSTISFIRAPERAFQEIDATLAVALIGPARDMLSLVSRRPIDALRTLKVKPEDAEGAVALSATISLQLGDDVPKDKEFRTFAASLDLESFGLKTPVGDRRVAGISGPILVQPKSATGEVTGTIDGVPAKIRFAEPLGPMATIDRMLEVDVAFSGEDVEALAPSAAGIVAGPITGRVVLKPGEEADFTATVDLSAASIELPFVGWRKGKGVKAAIAFDVASGSGGSGRTELKNLSVDGDGFSASGSVTLDKDGIRAAKIGKLAFNQGDDIDLSVERVSNGLIIGVEGEGFDARPFLNDLKTSLGARAAGAGPKSRSQIDVAIAIKRLTGFGGEDLGNFSLNYAGSGGDLAALSISGTAEGGGSFAVDVSPRGADRSIRISATDAGRLADFAGLYGRMSGGAVSLDLLGSGDGGYFGKLVAEDFTLVDEPRLSSLVGSSSDPSATSLSRAVGADLKTERAYFDHASAGIAYGKGGLRVSDGIIRGPVFGSSFSGVVYDQRNRIDIVGSFMPAYGLNRIFGEIPLFGQILGNGNEGGLIGITYRLDGAFASPTLTVNPISAIAPGIFRNIFAYQE